MPPDDHEERIHTLEEQVAELRARIAYTEGDAAAARVLAGGADRDVADMRAQLQAHTRLLNALRETQVEHGDRISALETRMEAGFREMDAGFREMRDGFATMGAGMTRIVTLIEGTQGPRAQP